jgi:uncharacterized protein
MPAERRPFQLLIKPVGPRCNLSCRYCFYSGDVEPEGSLPALMPEGVLERMIEKFLLLRLPESVFCWQGGEPTLAGLEFFSRAVKLQKRLGAGGQIVCNALQTNGQLIDDAWAEFLADYRFLVGLSIDGPAEIHDAWRTDRRGRGSLDGARRAALLFEKHGVEFNILTVVHSGNQERAGEILTWQLAQGWRHLQYIPCLALDGRGGGALPHSVTPEGYGRFLCDLWQAYRESGRRDVGIRDFDSWLCRLATGRHALCVFAERCADYLLVKPDGGLYPCDFFFEQRWQLGSVMADDLGRVFAEVREGQFGRLKGRLAEGCRSCRWLALCHGGCPKDRLPMGRDGEQMARSYLCQGYRMFFERHGAELEVLASELRRRQEAEQGVRRGRAAGAGRNLPCPCGSGRKFKQCCGR